MRNIKFGSARRASRLVVAVSAMAVGLTLPGCSPLGRERICSRGEHVVKSIEAPETGRTCVRNGNPPPSGYEEYPPGQVPTYLDEDDSRPVAGGGAAARRRVGPIPRGGPTRRAAGRGVAR